MQRPGSAWSGAVLFAVAAFDRVAELAGFYAGGPGFLNWLAKMAKAMLAGATLDTLVMVCGILLIA